MNNLIKTYIGFSIKSRSVIIGQDQLKKNKSKVYLIIYCKTASQNLKDLALRLGEKYGCNTLCLDENLQEYTNIQGCKILGLKNSSLSEAILKVAENKNEIGENNGK